MRIIRRLFTLFWTGLVLAMVLGAIGALAARRRIVPAAAADADDVELRAIFEPLHFESHATAFRGGTIECWYGGGVIDLRQATLDTAGARLDVRTVFGGGQIIVPEVLERHATGVVGIGGVGDTRSRVPRDPDAPHLTIERLRAVRRVRRHVRRPRGRAPRPRRADPALGASRPVASPGNAPADPASRPSREPDTEALTPRSPRPSSA